MDREQFLISVAKRLGEERKRLNKTQEEIALMFGLTSRTWGDYERGITLPDSWLLFRLNEFGADIFYILTGTKSLITVFSDDEEKIIKQYRNADETIKFAVNNIFDALEL